MNFEGLTPFGSYSPLPGFRTTTGKASHLETFKFTHDLGHYLKYNVKLAKLEAMMGKLSSNEEKWAKSKS